MALTGSHAAGDTGRLADDNLRDVSINANAVAIATKTTPPAAAAAAAALIVAEHDTERAHQSSTYAPAHVVAAPSGDATGATDLAAINAAITAANAGGGRGLVILQTAPSTAPYMIGSNLLMRSNVTLRGAGMKLTTIKLVAGGNAVITNLSWPVGNPATWAVTESDMAIEDLTVDENSLATRYGINFKACSGVRIQRVRAQNCTYSGIVAGFCYDVSITDCQTTATAGDGIFVYDCIRYDVSHNTVLDAGDFCIELGAGYDYGLAGGTTGAEDGICVGNKVANAVNYGIGVRGYIDASANPNNHYVDRLVIDGNTMRDCAGGEYAEYENVRNITYGANSVYHGGVLVPATKRYTADLNAGSDFTSGATGAVTDITGLTTTFTPATDVTARIYLRVRANSSVLGTNAIFVDITPAPLSGQALASDIKVVGGGNDAEHVVCHEVFLTAKTAYTVKAQFFQGSAGTFTVQHSSQNTELIVVTQPLI